jgi:hypothetical protein
VKVTKRQLRRIIKEEKQKLLNERGTGNPALRAEERDLIGTVVAFADAYMLTMGMNPGDPADAKRTRRTIDDIINSVMGGILK